MALQLCDEQFDSRLLLGTALILIWKCCVQQ
jgi:thiazole synthase ThiGH ThiG subunit